MRTQSRLMAVLAVAAALLFAIPASAEQQNVHIDLWDHEPAYKGDHAEATFQLDSSYTVISGTLDLTAFNDDDYYWRVVDFFLGGDQGDGGPIGVYYYAPGQCDGDGVMICNQQKHWVYDLSQVMIGDGSQIPPGYRYVDFIEIINNILASSNKDAVDIEVEAWVTTDAAGSWVSASLDLVVEMPGDDDDDTDDDIDDDIDDDTDDDTTDDDVADDDTANDDDTADDDTGGDDDDDEGCGCMM